MLGGGTSDWSHCIALALRLIGPNLLTQGLDRTSWNDEDSHIDSGAVRLMFLSCVQRQCTTCVTCCQLCSGHLPGLEALSSLVYPGCFITMACNWNWGHRGFSRFKIVSAGSTGRHGSQVPKHWAQISPYDLQQWRFFAVILVKIKGCFNIPFPLFCIILSYLVDYLSHCGDKYLFVYCACLMCMCESRCACVTACIWRLEDKF